MTFLEKLCQCGLTFDYFKICDISEIEARCCNGLKVIDFDKIAIKVCSSQNSTLKSCDALRISRTKNCMDFIELKKIEELIAHVKSPQKCIKQVQKLNLSGKIYDSFVIMRIMISHGHFKFTSEEISEYYDVPKNYIVAIDTKLDTEPLGMLNNTLTLLSIIPSSPMKSAIENLREIALKEINDQLRAIRKDGQVKLNSVDLITFQNIHEYWNT